jgi:hypothetical protein
MPESLNLRQGSELAADPIARRLRCSWRAIDNGIDGVNAA